MSDPRIWGPDLWKTIHRFTLFYPDVPSEDDKKAAIEFFHSLMHLLPCPACRAHYEAHHKASFTDEVVQSRETLVRWAYDLHNTVNRTLGKTYNVKLGDLPLIYNAFPMRYIDERTGDFLQQPRYVTTGEIVCPSDVKAKKALDRRLRSMHTAERREEEKKLASQRRIDQAESSLALNGGNAGPEDASVADAAGDKRFFIWQAVVLGAVVLLVVLAVVLVVVAAVNRRPNARPSKRFSAEAERAFDADKTYLDS